jgi:hypothetical protein
MPAGYALRRRQACPHQTLISDGARSRRTRAHSAVAAVLIAAAHRSDSDLHLALLTVEESGIAEYTG